MKIEAGYLAKSLAGHDKDEVFVILAVDGEYVSLVNGTSRTVEKPKRKRLKHIQPEYPKEENLQLKIRNKQKITNEEVKYFLKQYKAGKSERREWK